MRSRAGTADSAHSQDLAGLFGAPAPPAPAPPPSLDDAIRTLSLLD